MLANAALAARAANETDAARHVALARFFAETVAVQAPSLEKTVTDGAESVMAADAVLMG
jgi:acyl-CoA dehydrogenase